MVAADEPNPARRRELSDVLAEEFKAIRGVQRVNQALGPERTLDAALTEATAAVQERKPPPNDPEFAAELARRKIVYKVGYGLDLSALCLSGGGIRSAAISLGVIQALTDYHLLEKFTYLSTVSGGGYIGSWLSAWLYRVKMAGGKSADVLSRLGSRRNNPDVEVPPLDHLREYSNYLTPKLGLFSADTWAALAIVFRNIVVNWLILVPALALLVIAVKLLALLLTTPAYFRPVFPPADWKPPSWTWFEIGVAVICMALGGLALGYKLSRLYLPPYSEREHPDGERLANPKVAEGAQTRFLWTSLFPVAVAGLCFVWLAYNGAMPAVVFSALIEGVCPDAPAWFTAGVSSVLFGGAVWAVALLTGYSYANKIGASRNGGAAAASRGRAVPRRTASAARFNIKRQDLGSWVSAVLVFALLIVLGARFIAGLGDRTGSVALFGMTVQRESLIVIFGMPWFLLATMLAHDVYLLLNSVSRNGEVEREWLGRASGWHFIAGLGWIMLSAIVLLGPALYCFKPQTIHIATVVSGAVTGFLGKSGLSSATGKDSDWKGLAANIGLAIAGPVFAVLLLILLSVVIDWVVLGYPERCLPTDARWNLCRGDVWWITFSWRWVIPFGIAAIVLWIADRCANINAFSLHAIYRNRLIRCFLGGARDPHRHPDGFTDFDWDDDLRVAELWRQPVASDEWRPFHVINMTLNLADTNRLSWQQRKAMSFSVTPLACGAANLGYRRTEFYGGPYRGRGRHGEILSGISLGTAMAISGAAVSSNMGYHSSMSLSFLLTFFNVRLGVWLGNTGAKGDGKHAFYAHSGPRLAVPSLLSELFGMTTDESRYVYLSDGGHFEDLGLYEMVRRRCKWIVIVDGDQDRNRGFVDLGNAVRKISIDLGIHVSFTGSKLLASDQDAKLGEVPYFAVGTIHYHSDLHDVTGKRPEGKILYIKPVVRGDEPAADVIAYKRANRNFPAQTTADQWFDESQFESYRRLGQLMTQRIIEASGVKGDDQNLAALFDGLEKIDQVTMSFPAK